jgi:hypothetical protein
MLMVRRSEVEQEIADAVKRVEEALRPDVVRIRFSYGDDWTGEESVFYRVLLSDKAAKSKRLGKIAQDISLKLYLDVPASDFGLHSYTNFRSKSEQDELQDPEWS